MSEHPPFGDIPVAAKPVETISAVAAGPSDPGAFGSPVGPAPVNTINPSASPEPAAIPDSRPAPIADLMPGQAAEWSISTNPWQSGAGYPPQDPPPGWVIEYRTATTSGNAVAALILAIAAWVVCPVILAIVALVFASMARKEIDAAGGAKQGYGLATTARVLSWINIGLWAAILVLAIGVTFAILISGGLPVTTTSFTLSG